MEGFSIYTPQQKPTASQRADIVDFLFTHLDQYGDEKSAIAKCLEFALKEGADTLGGFALVLRDGNDEIMGINIVNKTGMREYIPENILVYIAVHEKTRGRGIGKKIMNEALKMAKGSVALHVEPDNPARFLYEK